MHPWEVPEKVWQLVHSDFCGPVWIGMWLVVVDAKSKWPCVIKMKTTTSEETTRAQIKILPLMGFPNK